MRPLAWIAGTTMGVLLWSTPAPGVVIRDQDESKVELSAALQLRYQRTHAVGERTTDETSLRRLRTSIAGTVAPNWWIKTDLDFGKALGPEEVSIRDAYLEYRGFSNVSITLGNSKTPFSRKFLYSWKRIQSSDWGFLADHNYGIPDRQLGLRVEAQTATGRLKLWVAGGAEDHDPDARFLDFDSPVNAADDWNEGAVAAVRLEMHPWGRADGGQGDFHTKGLRAGIGAAAFAWRSDGDNARYSGPAHEDPAKADLDQAEGVSLSFAVRGLGLSADVEVQRIEAWTVRPDFSGGIYQDGFGKLEKLGLLAGFMFPGDLVEAVAGWERLRAETYEQAWTVLENGANIYVNRYALRAQMVHRHERAIHGVQGEDASTVLFQILQSF